MRWKSLFLQSGSLFGEKKIPAPLRNREMSATNRHIGHLINTWSAPPTEPVSTSTLGPLALSVQRYRVESRRRASDSYGCTSCSHLRTGGRPGILGRRRGCLPPLGCPIRRTPAHQRPIRNGSFGSNSTAECWPRGRQELAHSSGRTGQIEPLAAVPRSSRFGARRRTCPPIGSRRD